MHGQVHVHAGMAYKFNHDMHACFARNYPESHCHIVAMGMTLFQLPKSLILEVLSIKHWRQSAFVETLLTVRHSRDARRRRASMLVQYNYDECIRTCIISVRSHATRNGNHSINTRVLIE